MGNRIDKNTSSTSNVSSTDSSTVENDNPSQTNGPPETDQAGDSSLFYTDQMVRGADNASEFEEMTTGEQPRPEGGSTESAEPKDAKSVLEMQLEQIPPKTDVDFEGHAFATELTDKVFANERVALFGRPPEDIDSAFRSTLGDDWGFDSKFADNSELLQDRGALEDFIAQKLAARGDAPEDADEINRVASRLVDNIEGEALRGVADRIKNRVRAQVEQARERLETINGDSQSRRTFLAQVADLEGDPGVLQERLAELGVGKDAAEEIADILADAHGNDEAIVALKSGEAGPETELHVEGGAYEHADELLGDELDKMDGKLERLSRDALGKQSQNKHALLFGDPNFAQVRAEVFDDLDISPNAPAHEVDNFDLAVSEALHEAEGKEGDSLGRFSLDVVTGLAEPPVLNALIRGGVGLVVKQEELELARAAEHAEMSSDDAVSDAEARRNAEVVKAAVNFAIARSNIDEKIADNAPEVIKGQPAAEEVEDLVGNAGESLLSETFNRGMDKRTDEKLDD